MKTNSGTRLRLQLAPFLSLLCGLLLTWPLPSFGEVPTELDDSHSKQRPRYQPKPKQRAARDVQPDDPLGVIVIMTDFDKAEVKIDGEEYPRHLTDGLIVEAGVTHIIKVNWDKSTKKTYKLNLDEGEVRVIMVDLSNQHGQRQGARKTNKSKQDKNKGVGYISVNSSPNGQVYIDGQMVGGETPVVKHEVTPGQHAVRVYYPDLGKYSETKKAVIHKGNHINLYFKGNQ